MPRIETEHQFESASSGNPLANIIEQRIQKSGPIPFDDYMSAWAYGVRDANGRFMPGFYNGNSVVIADDDSDIPFADRDFRTTPERTPLYGLVMANQIIELWKTMGDLADFRIVEMGAGNGTWANDILHQIQVLATMDENKDLPFEKLRYTIVEQSPTLILKQKERLRTFSGKVDFIQGRADNLPLQGFRGIVISNELPDAFPMKCVRKVSGQYQEAFIDKGDSMYFKLMWQEPDEETLQHLEKYSPQVGEEPFPINLSAEEWMKSIANGLEKGFVITSDYDHGGKFPVLYAALSKGINTDEPEGFLRKENMGRTDITGGVDFQMLSDAGKRYGLRTEGYVMGPGFFLGMDLDRISSKFFSEGIKEIGGRKLNPVQAEIAFSEASINILFQSKGVDDNVKISGLKYKTNVDGACYRKFRDISY